MSSAGDTLEVTEVINIASARMVLQPQMFLMRRIGDAHELLFVDKIVQVYNVETASNVVAMRAFRFSFAQLKADITSNVVRIRRQRFRELVDALQAHTHAPPSKSMAQFRDVGPWPCSAVMLDEVFQPTEHGALRSLHLVDESANQLTLTFR